MSKVSAVLLGAGESRRMGVDKLSLPWGRKSILEHCFETLLRSEVDELIVVLSTRNKGVRNQFRGRKVRTVINPLSKMGMSSSIRRGLQTIHTQCHGILIALGDQPLLKTRTINALIRTFDQGKGGIIVPSFRGIRGNPVIFDRKFRKELLNLRGDVGGRSIVESHPEDVCLVPVESIGVIKDVDTRSAYKPPILDAPEPEGKKARVTGAKEKEGSDGAKKRVQ
jgi:molybdenum cofactor cytidylyltransferase